ncbi:hypothetical protein PR202_ga20237 [Eleusine coracana subsp. coracana]|uniref:Response regulatory domain-containing protein n=1 Tax=Eleusine coracana subsp. coracana TaxID=191504 RepID=A0AAV5CW41_ELECO|nr:hypothetical protein PR202_ga20237 [Eleusine coracana subsp. coracana]
MEMEGRAGVEVEEGVMRVLLVDDSPVDRKVVQLLLNSNSCAGSFHVVAVDSAKKAMEFLGLKDGKFTATRSKRALHPVLATPRRVQQHGGGMGSCATCRRHAGPLPCLALPCRAVPYGARVCVCACAQRLLKKLGCDILQEQPIDMVLTDYCMPEMTGYDLLKAIKALNPLKPIPVIVMSSEDEPQRISRCLSAGAEDYIVKPLQSKDVPRLRNCSLAKPKGSSPCDAVTKRKPLQPKDHAAVGVASPSGRRAHFAGVAMARPCHLRLVPSLHKKPKNLSCNADRLCLLLVSFISGSAFVERRALALLPAPLQDRPTAVRRPVSGRAAVQMVIARLLTLTVVRLSCCCAVQFRAG